MKKKLLIPFLAAILALTMAASAFASGLTEKKQELNDVHKNITGTKEELGQVKDQQNDVRNQLSKIEQDLAAKQNELSAAENQLSRTQSELNATEQDLNTAREQLAQTQEQLDKLKAELDDAIQKAQEQEQLNSDRLRAMYMNSNASYLELLLESKSLNDLINRVDMVTKMIAFDQGVFDDLTRYRDEVEEKKTACEEQEAKIQQTKNEIEEKKASLEQKEKDMPCLTQKFFFIRLWEELAVKLQKLKSLLNRF